MQSGTFVTDGETLAYSHYVPAGLPNERALSLHGAGPAGRERFRYLAEHLVSRGSSAFSLDFPGHGESTGKLRESSLVRRAIQARAAIEFMPQFPTVLIGTSMGGHVASSIVAETRGKFLILFCPALYGDDCINVSFDGRCASITIVKVIRPSAACGASLHWIGCGVLVTLVMPALVPNIYVL
jgi:uncharacterized protein